MDKVELLYIDDYLETQLSEYLELIKNDLEITIYKQKEFKPVMTYEDLLNDNFVKDANIILIDSKLFQDRQVESMKFTGEEFEIILKKVYPYTEIILISQNTMDSPFKCVPKFNPGRSRESFKDHYDKHLKERIKNAISNIRKYRLIVHKLNSNKSVSKILTDKIIRLLDGDTSYSELDKQGIESLIDLLCEVKENAIK